MHMYTDSGPYPWSFDMERFVSRKVLDQITVRRMDRPDLSHIVYEAVREVAAYRAQEPLVVEYPANWWQHFKQRWFPAWALRRWPVLLTTQVHRAVAYLPNVPLRRPEDRETMFYGWKNETPHVWKNETPELRVFSGGHKPL